MGFYKRIVNPEILIYLIIGGLTLLVYFGFIALSVEVLKLHYRLGVSIAYLLAVCFHFLANRRFTFRSVDRPIILQLFRYLGILLINYLITLGVISFSVNRLGFSTYLSAALSLMVTVSVGYIALKCWVFRRRGSLRD